MPDEVEWQGSASDSNTDSSNDSESASSSSVSDGTLQPGAEKDVVGSGVACEVAASGASPSGAGAAVAIADGPLPAELAAEALAEESGPARDAAPEAAGPAEAAGLGPPDGPMARDVARGIISQSHGVWYQRSERGFIFLDAYMSAIGRLTGPCGPPANASHSLKCSLPGHNSCRLIKSANQTRVDPTKLIKWCIAGPAVADAASHKALWGPELWS